MSELDLSNHEPAYLCGRLLAVLDAIQSRALNNPNTTIVDRFYGSASSAPASVFGTLLHGAQAHLSKLRKDERSGTYVVTGFDTGSGGETAVAEEAPKPAAKRRRRRRKTTSAEGESSSATA